MNFTSHNTCDLECIHILNVHVPRKDHNTGRNPSMGTFPMAICTYSKTVHTFRTKCLVFPNFSNP